MTLQPVQNVLNRFPQYAYPVSYASFHRDVCFLRVQLAEQSEGIRLYDIVDYKQLLRLLARFNPVIYYFTLYQFAYQAVHDGKLQFSPFAIAWLQKALYRLPESYLAPCTVFLNELLMESGSEVSLSQIKANIIDLLRTRVPLERFSNYLIFFLESFYDSYVECLSSYENPVPLIKVLVSSPQRFRHKNVLINACLKAYEERRDYFNVMLILMQLFSEFSDIQIDYDKVNIKSTPLAVKIARFHPMIAIRLLGDADVHYKCQFLYQITESPAFASLFQTEYLDHLLKSERSRFFDDVLLRFAEVLPDESAVLLKLCGLLKYQTGYLGRQISDALALKLSRMGAQSAAYYEDLADACKCDEYLVYLCQLMTLDLHHQTIRVKTRISDVHQAHLNAVSYRLGLPFKCTTEADAALLMQAGFSDLNVLRRFQVAANLLHSVEFSQADFVLQMSLLRTMGYQQLMSFIDYLLCAEEHLSRSEMSQIMKRIQQAISVACSQLNREQARSVWRAMSLVGE